MFASMTLKPFVMKLRWFSRKMYFSPALLKKNLRWGKKDADEEELIRVCRLAQADEFIQQFPKNMILT